MIRTCFVLAVAGLLLVPRAFAQWTTTLEEDFNTLDDSQWTVGSNGGGSAEAVGGVLEITSGTLGGGGTWVESIESFDLTECDYAVAFRLRQSAPAVGTFDGSFGGFYRQSGPANPDQWFMGFGVEATAIDEHPAETRWKSWLHVSDTPGLYWEAFRKLGGTGWEVDNDYRVEFVQGTVTFYVNDFFVWSYHLDELFGSFHVRFDKPSAGENTQLFVDYVRVERGAACALSAPVGSPAPTPDHLLRGTPNPFSTLVEISYAVGGGHTPNVTIFDIRGRAVRTLLGTAGASGIRRTTWDGLDDHGRAVAAGVYFCELDSEGTGAARLRLVKER